MPDRPTKFLASLYGGIVIATISTIPGLNLINCLCCAGIILGGFLSVFIYSRQLTPETTPLTAGDGLLLGALAGVIATFLSLILHLLVYALFGDIAERILYNLIRVIFELANVPPEVSEIIEERFREALERGLTPFVLLLKLLTDLVIFTLFGLLGGLIGFSVFRKSGQQTQPVSSAP